MKLGMRKVGPFYQEAIPIFFFWPCEDESLYCLCSRSSALIVCIGGFLLREFSFHFIFINWLIQIYNFIFSLSYK